MSLRFCRIYQLRGFIAPRRDSIESRTPTVLDRFAATQQRRGGGAASANVAFCCQHSVADLVSENGIRLALP
jgi:hypothetical protein